MKSYIYRVRSGGQYIAQWGGVANATAPVISEPSFSAEVDGSISPMDITLEVPYDSSVNGLTFGNVVETWCADADSSGVLVHAGTIERIQRSLTPSSSSITVSVEPFVAQLARDYFRDDSAGTDIEKVWGPTEVATMLRYLIDRSNARSTSFARLFYTSSSVQNSGVAVSNQVGSETYLSALQRIKAVGPGNFYWHVSADGTFYYRNYDSGTRHILTIGRETDSLTATTDLTEVRNTIYFWNGSDADNQMIALERSSSTSQALYGRRAEIITDTHIGLVEGTISAAQAQATAEAATNNYLAEHRDPSEEYQLVVNDGTGNTIGYDIESLRPGDTVEVRNCPLLDGRVLSLVRVDYAPDAATITLGSGPVRRPRTMGMSFNEMQQYFWNAVAGSIPSTTTA